MKQIRTVYEIFDITRKNCPSTFKHKLGTSTHLVSVPVVVCSIETLTLVCFHQLFIVVHTHGAPYYLTNIGQQDVDGLCVCRIILAALHVERFDVGRESVQDV